MENNLFFIYFIIVGFRDEYFNLSQFQLVFKILFIFVYFFEKELGNRDEIGKVSI